MDHLVKKSIFGLENDPDIKNVKAYKIDNNIEKKHSNT